MKVSVGPAAQTRGTRAIFAMSVAAAVTAALLPVQVFAADSPEGAASNDESSLQEIVVTAQRREEPLQRIGIPVSAVTGAELQAAGVSSQSDLTRLIPSVAIFSGGQGSTQAALRGVGNLSGNTYAEQAIAFSLDGSYLARGEAIGGNFFDLERVEVLKGPQGTLYGRNTNAGAINLITRKPTFDGASVELLADVGNYDKYSINAAANLPTGATSALRLAGQRIYHSGYFSDGYNDQDESAARAIWLWQASDAVTLWISGDASRVRGMGSTGALAPKSGDFWDGPSTAGQQARWLAAGAYPVHDDGHLHVDNYGFTGQVDWATAAGTLTVLPSFRKSDEDARHYAAGYAVDFAQHSKTKAMEARFATPTEHRLSGIVGLYYFKEDADFTLTANQLGGNPDGSVNLATSFIANNIIPTISTESKAVFGQGAFKITDTFRLVAGARYTSEDKATAGLAKAAPATVFAFVPFTPVNTSLSANKTTGKVGLEFDVRPESLVYLSYSTGFKAGGFFASPGGTFKPETLRAYTLGSKNRFLADTLQFNIEVYHWKYQDKQVSHLGFLPSGAVDLVTENAGNATMYGIEPEMVWLVSKSDRVNLAVQYEHTKYDDFVYLSPAPAPGPGGCSTSAGPPPFTIDCSGRPLPSAPKWSVVAGYNHTFVLANGGSLVGDVTVRHRTETISGEEQLPAERNDAYTTEDFTLTYRHPRDRWSLAAYVYNLSDEHSTTNSFFYGGTLTGVSAVGPITLQNPPRTYGVRVNVAF